ncbi:TPA: tyrosine-type recombinase/integrase [Clostridioides difficile]
MATKRANGEGSIGKYKDGWRSRIMIGYNEDGKPIRKEFYGKTQKEVKDKLDAYKKQYYLSSDISDDKITLEHWFYNWLFEYRIKDLKPKSFERYESIYRNYIKDTDLGNVKLKDLRVSHIQKYYNRLLDSNKSIPTIRQINTKLKTCLSEAEKQGLIQRNYCTMVNIPVEKKENKLEILTLEQQKSFIKAIDGHKLEVLFLLALGTGLRLGDDDDKIRLNQRKPSKYKGLRRFGPEKNLQRINKFMKERPIFYKNFIQMKENFRFYLRCFYCITKVVILQFNSENRTELARNG